jgi:hypothetical protein
MHHMKAKLVFREKYIYADGSLREMVLWQLPEQAWDKPFRLKYRLYYGLADGTCLVLYDNEQIKGDHRHIGDKEEFYQFRNVETLVADFLEDVSKARRHGK